jgi:hypothetical protein
MLHQLPVRLFAAALVAVMWAVVTRDPSLGGVILCCAAAATATRDREAFPVKLERALLVGIAFAVIRLYVLRQGGD